MNILHLPSCHQKCHPQCVWSRDVTRYEPVGFRRTLTKLGGFSQIPAATPKKKKEKKKYIS
jgi:hypothetical protein